MADVFDKLVKDGGPIGQHMDRAHGYFAFPKLEGELGPRMKFRGKEMIVWSLNNYLGGDERKYTFSLNVAKLRHCTQNA